MFTIKNKTLLRRFTFFFRIHLSLLILAILFLILAGFYPIVRFPEEQTVYMLPMGKMPFFPFNYLTSQPSYRADETGRIRMLRVHRRNHLCPEDAPVVMRVETEDIEDAFDNLVQNIGWSDKISQEK